VPGTYAPPFSRAIRAIREVASPGLLDAPRPTPGARAGRPPGETRRPVRGRGLGRRRDIAAKGCARAGSPSAGRRLVRSRVRGAWETAPWLGSDGLADGPGLSGPDATRPKARWQVRECGVRAPTSYDRQAQAQILTSGHTNVSKNRAMKVRQRESADLPAAEGSPNVHHGNVVRGARPTPFTPYAPRFTFHASRFTPHAPAAQRSAKGSTTCFAISSSWAISAVSVWRKMYSMPAWMRCSIISWIRSTVPLR
jgi:hypothetical protein